MAGQVTRDTWPDDIEEAVHLVYPDSTVARQCMTQALLEYMVVAGLNQGPDAMLASLQQGLDDARARHSAHARLVAREDAAVVAEHLAR